MNGETENTGTETANQENDRGERQRSTISFPYMGLSEAMEMAAAIYNNVAGGDCDDDQLAAWLGLSPKSSGYRVRLTAARMFGVLETVSTGTHRLSELGLEVVDDNRAPAAKVTAFLNVELYKVIFDKWRGRQLPPAAALEREMVTLGVAEKQKDKARQVFERSASTAGFFEHGRDRLVRPGIAPSSEDHADRSQEDNIIGGGDAAEGRGGGGDHGLPPKIDPIIAGLIARLPESGTIWSKDERKLWLQILENSFELVYKEKIEELPSPDRFYPDDRRDDQTRDM